MCLDLLSLFPSVERSNNSIWKVNLILNNISFLFNGKLNVIDWIVRTALRSEKSCVRYDFDFFWHQMLVLSILISNAIFEPHNTSQKHWYQTRRETLWILASEKLTTRRGNKIKFFKFTDGWLAHKDVKSASWEIMNLLIWKCARLLLPTLCKKILWTHFL